ncbi:MAG: vitamin K epoxide reductase family protein [Candidatus Poseidoniaceae archaeon]
MNEYVVLSFHGAIILFGVLLLTPMGVNLSSVLHSRYPSTTTKRGQLIAGMAFICFGGFTVSAHTLWMHNKLSEGASVCSGDSILNCDGLIGNVAYNTDPLLGQPWGMIGMVAFTALMWIVIVIGKEPMSSQTQMFIKAGLGATIAGLPVIALLVSYEIKEGLICPFCTTAHIANILALIGFILLFRLYESGEWAPDMKKSSRK